MYRPGGPITSLLAAQHHQETGLSERREQVLRLVFAFPGCTSGELSRLMVKAYPTMSLRTCVETPHKRLPELRDMGLVKEGRVRECADSGYEAITWWPVYQITGEEEIFQ